MTPRARPRIGVAIAAAVLAMVAVTAGDVVAGAYLPRSPGPAPTSASSPSPAPNLPPAR